MARFMTGSGSFRAAVDLPTEQLVRNLVDHAAPGVVDAVEQAADGIVAEARAKWPVRTGTSRDGLEAQVVIAPGLSSIRATVVNEVEYARFIKARKLGGKSAMVELLQKPIRERTAALVSVLGKVVGG